MVIELDEGIRISSRKINKILHDPQATAKAVQLIYVNNSEDGYIRVRRGKSFGYQYKTKALKDKDALQRIKSLVLPPAWENVWICTLHNGHLQATGMDARNRKQYRYHPLWNQLRNHTKFYRMLEFGEALPAIRKQVNKDLGLEGTPKEKVLAAVVSLMESTSIRIGNGEYEKANGSFGLTTLKDKHVNISGNEMKFCFKGKKGVIHNISLRNKKLAKIVKQCRDIPGKELFQYIGEDGERRTIDSGMVNEYLKNITGGEFTAKDFRTWAGSVYALQAFKEKSDFETVTEARKNIVAALDEVSKHLGNTRTVCKKYYVHPELLNLYENKKLGNYLQKLGDNTSGGDLKGLSPEEEVMMELLKKI